MRTWLLHAGFALILAASLAVNGRAGDVLTDRRDIWPALIRVVRWYGLAFHEESMLTGAPVRRLLLEAPDCARPISVVVLSVTFDEEPLIRTIRHHDDVARYVYLGRTWNTPERLAAIIEWQKNKTLAIFGLTKYVSSPYLLLVDTPPGCQLANFINWQLVWDRDYLTADPH